MRKERRKGEGKAVIGLAYDNVRPLKRDGRTQTTFSVAKAKPQIVSHFLLASFRVCLGTPPGLGPRAGRFGVVFGVSGLPGRGPGPPPRFAGKAGTPSGFRFGYHPQTWPWRGGPVRSWATPSEQMSGQLANSFFGIFAEQAAMPQARKGPTLFLATTSAKPEPCLHDLGQPRNSDLGRSPAAPQPFTTWEGPKTDKDWEFDEIGRPSN